MKACLFASVLLFASVFLSHSFAQEPDIIEPAWIGGEGRFARALISPDNKYALIQGSEWRIFDMETGEEIFPPEPLRSAVTFTGDSQYLLTFGSYASAEDFARLYDTSTWTVAKSFDRTAETQIEEMDISADGSILATVDSSWVLDVYNAITGEHLDSLSLIPPGSPGGIGAISISADGSRLAVGLSTVVGEVNIYDTSTGAIISSSDGFARFPAYDKLDISPDGSRVIYATRDLDSQTLVVNTDTGEMTHTIDHEGGGNVLRFVGDSKVLVLGYKAACLYSLETVPATAENCPPLESYHYYPALYGSPDGSILIGRKGYDYDKTIVAFTFPEGDELWSLPEYLSDTKAAGYLNSTNEFWILLVYGRLRMYDAEDRSITREFFFPSDKFIQCGDVSRDGKTLCKVGWSTGTLDIFDLEAGKMRFSVPIEGVSPNDPHDIDISPDGKSAILGTSNGNPFFCYDLETGEQRWALESEYSLKVEFSPDGQTAYLADNALRVVDVATGIEEKQIKLPTENPDEFVEFVVDCKISPSGRYLYTHGGGYAGVYDLTAGEFLWTGDSSYLWGAAWAPDDAELAISGMQSTPTTAYIVDPRTGELLSGFLHDPKVGSTPADGLAFSRTGKYFFLSSFQSRFVLYEFEDPMIIPWQAVAAYIPMEFYHDLNEDGVVDAADQVWGE